MARKPERIRHYTDIIRDLSIRVEKGVSDIVTVVAERKIHTKKTIKKTVKRVQEDSEILNRALADLSEEI